MKTLLSSPSLPQIAAQSIVAYSSRQTLREILDRCVEKKLSTAELFAPSSCLSPARLREYLSKESFSTEEAVFLCKMLVWQSRTKTGNRHEISLDRSEEGMFDLVSDVEKKDVFWKNSLKNAAGADVILIHHSFLAQEPAQCTREGDIGNRELVIADAHNLEDSLTAALRIRYTEARLRPIFGEKIALTFGLLGIFFEKFSVPGFGGFLGNVILNDGLRASIEWKRFEQAMTNTADHIDAPMSHRGSNGLGRTRFVRHSPELADPPRRDVEAASSPELEPRLGLSEKNRIISNFAHDPARVMWISSFAEEVAFHSAPRTLENIFQTAVAEFERITIHSSASHAGDGFGLIKKLFGLDSIGPWDEKSEESAGKFKAEIIIPEKFPEPFSAGYFKKCVELFDAIIKGKKGGCLFLLSSKKVVEAIYQTLLPMTSSDTRLLAVGPSGGTGKACALFAESPEKCVLLATTQLLPYLEELEEMLSVIVFQKIPFDPPDDPICAARSSQFENSFEQYTLPRAVMKFRAVVNECIKKPSLEKLYILDSRIRSRGYGSAFV